MSSRLPNLTNVTLLKRAARNGRRQRMDRQGPKSVAVLLLIQRYAQRGTSGGLARCQDGKIIFSDKAAATACVEELAKLLGRTPQYVYACEHHRKRHFHLTGKKRH